MSSKAVAVVGHVLVVSEDALVASQLARSFQRFSISVEICTDIAESFHLIKKRKFEALVVDLAYAKQASMLLEQVRFSPSNRNCVTFAIQDCLSSGDFPAQANFTIQKPVQEDTVETTVRASLGLIIREYRRYFRCPVAVPADLQVDNATEFECQILNISEGGAAVITPNALNPGTLARICFTLPDDPMAFVLKAEVCWSDNKTRAGLQFQSNLFEERTRLQEWLSRRIEQGLPESIARLFQRHQ